MINVLITADSRYQVDKNFLKAVAISTLELNKIRGKIELSISIVGDRAMGQLGKKYLRRPEACDVLAFPLEETTPSQSISGQKKVAGFPKSADKILRLGDIVISYPQALSQAAVASISIEEELAILTEHGIGHLLGIHHQ